MDRIEAGSTGGGGAAARVTLADGRSVAARRGVVVATEGPEARRLLGDRMQVGAGALAVTGAQGCAKARNTAAAGSKGV